MWCSNHLIMQILLTMFYWHFVAASTPIATCPRWSWHWTFTVRCLWVQCVTWSFSTSLKHTKFSPILGLHTSLQTWYPQIPHDIVTKNEPAAVILDIPKYGIRTPLVFQEVSHFITRFTVLLCYMYIAVCINSVQCNPQNILYRSTA